MPISAMGMLNNNSVQVEQKSATPPPDATTQSVSNETQSSPAVIIDISESTLSNETTAPPDDEAASRAQAERVREAYLRDSLISQIGTVSEAEVSLRPLEKDVSERAVSTYNSSKASPATADDTARVSVSA